MKTIEEQIHELKFKGEEFNANDFNDWAKENSDEAYKLCLQVANFNNNLALSKGDVMLSLPLFRQLFDELINAGRDMRDRDRLGLYYLTEDEYFENVVKRYSNNGNGA